MAIQDDFTIAVNGDIRHTANNNHYTVLELHRWLQDEADNAQAVDTSNDFVDITTATPSERATDNIITLINGFNIDDDAAEYLYDGSIENSDGTLYSGLTVLGAVNNTATQIVVIQDNALYTYTTTPASPFWGTQAGGGYNGDAASGLLMKCLIKTSIAGSDIDGKRIRVQARHWGDTYDFFNVQMGTGSSVAALGTTPDAQNNGTQGTVTAYAHVTNTEGYQTIDLSNGNGPQPYYSQWTYGADTSGDGIKGIYEYIKDLTGNTTAKTIHGINGELFLGVTHEYAYDTETGASFIEDDVITWGTGATAGTGLLLALNDGGTTGTVWMQLLTGVAPTDGLTISNEAADGTHDLNGAPTLRTIPKIFLGSYTGTLIGAFGVGLLAGDLSSSDRITDLLNVNQTPPNNQTFTVSGLVASEDYVLVGPEVANDFEFDQLTSNAVETGAAVTSLLMSAVIPTDTPSSGTLRIHLASGIRLKVAYSSYTGSTFTIASTDFSGDNSNADKAVMISYIDVATASTSESFTAVYSSNRDLRVRRRDGGAGSPTKTYESNATFTSSGGSAVAARITDA